MSTVVGVAGLPVYFIDSVITEDAGDGNVRVINCVTRHGGTVPVFEVIIHSTRLLEASRAVSECAHQVQCKQQLAPLHKLRMDGRSH